MHPFKVLVVVAFGFASFVATHQDEGLFPTLAGNWVAIGNNGSDHLQQGSLIARQGQCRPPIPITCGPYCCPLGFPTCCPQTRWCCETGGICLPPGAPYNCCKPGSNTCGGTRCCAPGTSCCGTGCCNAGRSCCGGRGCCPAGRFCRREDDSGDFVCEVPDVAEPVEFNVKDNPELAENMCRSMRARGITNNQEILRIAPKQTKAEQRAIRRKAYCGGRRKCPKGQSCDEYPPRSTQEGYDGLYGLDVFSQCINARQNSRGGNQLQKLYGRRSTSKPAGTKFVVRVKGLNCDTITPADPGPIQTFPPRLLKPRQLDTGRETTLIPPDKDDPSAYALIPLGDLDPANYTLVLTSNAQIDEWYLFDAPALDIANGLVVAANSRFSVPFTLEDPASGVTMVAFTKADSIGLDWSLTIV